MYGWSYLECLSKTMPQIIMLGHVADVSRQRLDKRVAKDRKPAADAATDDGDPVIWNGKRLSEMSSAEYKAYSNGSFAGL